MSNPEKVKKAYIPEMFETVDRMRANQKTVAATVKRLNESIGNHLKGDDIEKPDNEELGEIEELSRVLNKLEQEIANNLHDLDDYMNRCLGPVETKAKKY